MNDVICRITLVGINNNIQAMADIVNACQVIPVLH